MRSLFIAVVVSLLWASFLSPFVTAQDPVVSSREALIASVRIDSLDRFSRVITFRTPDGLLHNVSVGRELKAFDNLREGDTVSVRVVESVVVAVNPRGRPTTLTDTTQAAKKEGDGGNEVLQQLKVTVTIENVDPSLQTVTYKAADNRSVTRQVADPRLLEGLKRGDVVDISYTRERAIELLKR